jgi:hypothetical protein
MLISPLAFYWGYLCAAWFGGKIADRTFAAAAEPLGISRPSGNNGPDVKGNAKP